MKVLIDEMLPSLLKGILQDHQVSTVQEMGWMGVKNGELIKRANGNFDVFLTGDKNLRYQQNLSAYQLAFVILPSNRVDELREISGKLTLT